MQLYALLDQALPAERDEAKFACHICLAKKQHGYARFRHLLGIFKSRWAWTLTFRTMSFQTRLVYYIAFTQAVYILAIPLQSQSPAHLLFDYVVCVFWGVTMLDLADLI